jgi:hypothetical protein
VDQKITHEGELGVINKDEVLQKIEQISELLECARDYDMHVLKDLHRWFNHLFRQGCSTENVETAAVSGAAARVIETMLLCGFSQRDSSGIDDKERIKFRLVEEVNRRLTEASLESIEAESAESTVHCAAV